MPEYSVRNGYCLHLPHGRCLLAGERVELTGDLEKQVLKEQGWKVEPIQSKPIMPVEQPLQTQSIDKPPLDRAIKSPREKK